MNCILGSIGIGLFYVVLGIAVCVGIAYLMMLWDKKRAERPKRMPRPAKLWMISLHNAVVKALEVFVRFCKGCAYAAGALFMLVFLVFLLYQLGNPTCEALFHKHVAVSKQASTLH